MPELVVVLQTRVRAKIKFVRNIECIINLSGQKIFLGVCLPITCANLLIKEVF